MQIFDSRKFWWLKGKCSLAGRATRSNYAIIRAFVRSERQTPCVVIASLDRVDREDLQLAHGSGLEIQRP
jgi:hypothetical protein